MTASRRGDEHSPLPDDAPEADALEQRAPATPVDDIADDGDERSPADLEAFGDEVTTVEANLADVAEQHQVVPMDLDERDDAL
ncbi:hypothetical protein [Saccharothrix coeruleofusca]|nr:hypothetical protein [Saccharothrix coeruleofusca]MBP2335849.1 hypothetical protein [Saccharothrix coeruleofusca]